MANRTFKVYGQAYAASGDVTATLTINGTQVFNGAVNDSTTVREAHPTIGNHLWSFELDENASADQAVSITVSGGEVCVGPTLYNGVGYGYSSYAVANGFTKAGTDLTAEDQTWLASIVTADDVGADLYARMQAGTANNNEDAAIVDAVVASKLDWATYITDQSTRRSAQVNGVDQPDWDDDAVNKINWIILNDGDVFTYTWSLTLNP